MTASMQRVACGTHLGLLFIHLKLEIALAIPASNKWTIETNDKTYIFIYTLHTSPNLVNCWINEVSTTTFDKIQWYLELLI